MISPISNELPNNILGNYFDITFSTSKDDPLLEYDIVITPLFDITQHNINISGDNISGSYTGAGSVVYKTVFNNSKYSYIAFNDIPEGHEVYKFITSNISRKAFKYKVTDGQETKIYTHYSYTNWTNLSQDFRSIFT